MSALTMRVSFSGAEQADLKQLPRVTSTPSGIARQRQCIVMLAEGASYPEVRTALGVTDRFVARWKQPYLEGDVLALADAPRARWQDHPLTAVLEAHIVHLTQHSAPPPALTHWTAAHLAGRVGVSPSTILRA